MQTKTNKIIKFLKILLIAQIIIYIIIYIFFFFHNKPNYCPQAICDINDCKVKGNDFVCNCKFLDEEGNEIWTGKCHYDKLNETEDNKNENRH